MIEFIKKLFGAKPAAAPVVDAKVEAANSAPYKVPEPVAVTPVAAVAETKPVKAAAPKKQAAKKAAPEKPEAKTPATKGRKPKAK